MPLSHFHPVVAEWFQTKFQTPTLAQVQGWPAIAAHEDTLIAAPTGSGKTLAAFLYCIDRLLQKSWAGTLSDQIEVVYVSPLKALSNDVEKNLALPLAEITALALTRGLPAPTVRLAVRTGDTSMSERQKMVRRPPHVLITTPESLYILLTAEKSRQALRSVKTVIVDEIHAVASNKRGAHLALTLERLEQNAELRPVRIGLSATQRPIDEVARFLVGAANVDDDGNPACNIVDSTAKRRIDLCVETPKSLELSSVASHEQWAEVYDRVAQLVSEHRATLVFCNTRRHVERASHALAERLGEDSVEAHHGSLSHKLRRKAELRLKAGEVKAVVATGSLELGIDVGTVDLVVQLGSPRSLSVLVQRIGRSGHMRGGVPKGRLFAMTRDEVLECGALVRALANGELDRVKIRSQPIDILSQQIVAACAAADWHTDELFALIKRSWSYRNLSRADFDELLTMLGDGIANRNGRSGAHLHLDAVNGRVRGRRGARLAAITSGGAIPDNADYAVIAEPDGVRVGTLDEDFAIESLAGDIFLLGNTSWRIRRVESGTVRVEDAKGAPPSVPFWNGEAPGRSDEASAAVSAVRSEIEQRLKSSGEKGGGEALARAFLVEECGLDAAAAEQSVAYLAAVSHTLGLLPTQTALVAERFFDEAGGMQLILHAPFGARINRAWGLALRKRFCRSFNFELQAAATDDGIVLSLGPQHSFPLDSVFQFLTEDTLEEVLVQAILGAPMFATRWRWTATRSLALLRVQGGKRVPPQILRMRSEDLLGAVFPHAAACPENLPGGDIEIPKHPLVDETIRDCLTEPLDLAGAKKLIAKIQSGEIALHARDLPEASPLSHAILNANPYAYLDDAPLEERRTRAVMMRRTLPGPDRAALGALDPEAIARVVAEAWPEVRDADELHDLLLTLNAFPDGADDEARGFQKMLDTLCAAGRAHHVLVAGKKYWVAAERLRLALAAWPDTVAPVALSSIHGDENIDAGVARRALVAARMEFAGPITSVELARALSLSTDDVDAALAGLESEGMILRGQFRAKNLADGNGPVIEWCHRRLLARIHQLTLGRLRREIEPVSAAVLYRYLIRHQHVLAGTQLHGVPGLAEIVSQLQGVDAAAGAWERDILPARLGSFQPEWLDLLCLRGEATWGRLDLRVRDFEEGVRRVGLTRATPIAILRRDDLGWLLQGSDEDRKAARARLGPVAARVLDHLALSGASFFSDLVRHTNIHPADLEEAIGELVASGLVTGDGFASLRGLLEGRRRWARSDQTSSAQPFRPSSLMRQLHRQPPAPGRFSLFLVGAELPPEEIREAWAMQLLRRWGVVFRDLVQRDAPLPWRELSSVYRRLEARGDVRGGRFVAGFVGEQFALPEAVDALRALRREEPCGEEVVIAATDPLNLVGTITPGPRVPSVAGNRILIRDGVPIASLEAGAVVERANVDHPETLVTRLMPPPVRAQSGIATASNY